MSSNRSSTGGIDGPERVVLDDPGEVGRAVSADGRAGGDEPSEGGVPARSGFVNLSDGYAEGEQPRALS
jgi:hypothetical protein